MHLTRPPVSERLMVTLPVVKFKIPRQAFVRFLDRLIALEINILIFDGAPQPLDKDVVQCTAAGIHADPDVTRQKSLRETFAGKLAALI